MASTIYDAAKREELLRRLGSLRPDTAPRWGKMNAPMMLTHLLESYRMPSGELDVGRAFVPLRPLVRFLMLYVLPFPKGVPTAPQLLARKPASWDGDVAALRQAIASQTQPPAGTKMGYHPVFGAMSIKDWGVLVYKHTDHHFRQFGV